MHIAVLGPLEITTDDGTSVPVPGAKERLLLAALTAAAPHAVSLDRLAESMWNGSPPASARKTFQIHVVRLRSALEPDRIKGSPGRNAGGSERSAQRRGRACSRPVSPWAGTARWSPNSSG